MSFQEFTQRVLEKFNISPYVMKMHYTLKFNPKVIQDLKDEDFWIMWFPTVMTLQLFT